MRYTSRNFSIDQLLAEAEGIQRRSRLFRIYAHAPTLFELLVSLERQLSCNKDLNRVSPDDVTWNSVLENLRSLYKSGDASTQKHHVLFYMGQIAMLLDCIRSRDAHLRDPNMVRLFV